jgi:hypothetical protein
MDVKMHPPVFLTLLILLGLRIVQNGLEVFQPVMPIVPLVMELNPRPMVVMYVMQDMNFRHSLLLHV